MSLVCGFWRDKEGAERTSSSLTHVDFQILCSDWHFTCASIPASDDGLLFSHKKLTTCCKDLTPCPDRCITTWHHLLMQFDDRIEVHDKNNNDLNPPLATFALETQDVAASEKDFQIVDKNGDLHIIDEECHLHRPPFSLSWKIKKLACGMNHVLLLNTIGNIYTQGLGSRGQLGLGDLESSPEPAEVEALSFVSVVDVSCGFWHSCCCTDNGDVYVWGWNEHGQLGLPCRGTGGPRVVPLATQPLPLDLPDVANIACGSRHTVLLSACGHQVLACGWNKYHQVSESEKETIDHPEAMNLPPGGHVVSIQAGMWSSWLKWHSDEQE